VRLGGVIGASWLVGDIAVNRIDSSNFLLPTDRPMPEWAVPSFTTSIDETPLAFSALVVRTPTSTVVVDPWLVDDGPRSRPDADAAIAALLDELEAVGATAEEVDAVVLSHVDGIGWSTRPTADGWHPTFPSARYLLPAAELNAIDRGTPINGAHDLGPLRQAGVLHAVEHASEVVPGVRLMDAPGHNFGHVAVRIEDGDALAIYPGHLVLSLLQVDDPGADAGEIDLATATETRRLILDELADRRGILLTTLIGGPGGGVVERRGAGYQLVS
jgi:glyoxylase-like metal-dependent hydrolase (beta-lactamase superfamily II)